MGLIGEVYADARLHLDKASFTEYGSMLMQAEGQISELSSFSQTALTTGAAGVSAAITGVIAYGTSIASTFEDASTTLTTVYGDLDVAREKFEWLGDFAASTPFEFPELLDATVKLKSYGIEAETYMGTVGDASAAMGKTLNDTTEAVADAMTGEFERLKEYGIKAIQITKNNYQQMGATMSQVGMTALQYTNKAGEEQYKIVDRNNRQMVLSTIQSIWDVEKGFKGAMEARSKTLSGMASTLKDNLTMGLADLVGFDLQTMEVQAGSLMGVFEGLIGVAVDLTDGLSEIPEPIQAMITVAALGVAGIGALAAGFVAYSAILPLVTADTAIFGVTLSAALWPATAVVAAVALVAAGLVYLDEKTGLVTASWQLFSDMVTIVWNGLKDIVGGAIDDISDALDRMEESASEMGFGELQGLVDSLGNSFGNFKTKVSGFVSDVHGVAEGYRTATGDISTSTDDAAKSVEEAEGKAEEAHSSWLSDILGFSEDAAEGYGEVANAAEEVKSTYDKAIEEMNSNLEQKQKAQIQISIGVDTQDFERGVQLADGSLLILNEDGELVHHTLEGVDEKLTDLGDHHFETTSGGLDVLVTDGSNIEKTMERADNIVNETDDDVVVLNTSYKNLDSAQLVGLNGQIVTVQDSTQNTWTLVDDLSNNFVELNGQNLSGINGQVQNVDSATTTASGKVWTLQEDFQSVNQTPLTTLQGNIMTSGSMVDTSNQKTNGWSLTLANTNNSPFSTLHGNLSTSGVNIDTNNSKTGTWNFTLGSTNNSPFSTLHGNLGTAGTSLGTNDTKTGIWNNTLGRTNASPFGTLFGNLVTGGLRVDTLKGKTDNANTSMGTLGSFSFSTTLSNLGKVYDSLVDIYEQAKDTISKLFEVGNAKSSSSASGGGGGGASGVQSSGGKGTGETNVKVNQVNNYNTTSKTSPLKSIGL